MSTIAELEKEVAELKEEVAELKEEVADLDAELDQNQTNLDVFTTYLLVLIDRLHPEIETSEVMLKALNGGLKDLGNDAPDEAKKAFAYAIETVKLALPRES